MAPCTPITIARADGGLVIVPWKGAPYNGWRSAARGRCEPGASETRAMTFASPVTSTRAMKILVVDDDPKLRAFVTRGLAESGMQCATAPDGETALALLRRERFDLMLLDVMLPGLQGWDVQEAARKEGLHVPVIWVTARDALDERLRGLAMGDDYVVKPFAFAELVARIHAVLRRHEDEHVLRIADLEVDLLAGAVRRAGRALDLTRTEFSLLRQLAEHAGETVSRSALLKSVWNIDFDPGTNVVDVHIRRLRRKIDEPFGQPLIHTVRGSGYVLAAAP
jgi:two-component system, OmpR family, copper resistance phosphate regulon response regulator CusR